jgi:hypothetical protein
MRPVRPRWQLNQIETLEDRLAMSAEPVYDFFATAAESDVEQLGAGVSPLGSAVHTQTGVAGAVANYGFDGSGQTVAVIDTGIAWDHYALGHGFGDGYRVVGGWDFAENDANPYDDGPAGFHGTHVAGIIGSSDSKYNGVATGVDLVALRVFNDQGGGKFEWVEAALRWVHEHRFDFDNPITTVNLSIGQQWNAETLPNWATLEEELKQLHDDGIFISVAAGNDFAKFNAPGLSYPAVSPYVVPVGSVTSAGTFSSFSQRDDRILAAPGQSITSTLPDWFMGGNKIPNDFGAASGTSMAAPYVAGAAVLVREAMEFAGYTNITQDTIYAQLRNTADTFYDSVTKASYFRINVGRAIDTLMPADEAGGTFDTAQRLGGIGDDTQLVGIIGKKTDVDAYRFTANVSGTITLDIDSRDDLAADVKVTGATLQTSGGKLSFRVTAGQEYGISIGTKAGIGHYTIGVAVAADNVIAPPPQVVWGQVSQNSFNDLKVAGETWYQISATRDGWLTIESLLSGGNVRVELLNANQQSVAAFDASGSYGRLDANVIAGGTYFVRVTGNASDVDFRLTNLVSQAGGVVNVFGTAGDDVFSYAAAQQELSINGVSYRLSASTINFSGNGGSDTANLFGTIRNEVATFMPDSAALSGSGFRVVVTGAKNVTFDGAGGDDRLDLTGTAGDDLFTIARGDASLIGGGFNIRGLRFNTVNAIAGAGDDEARLFDTTGNDRFTAYATSATLSGAGYAHTVRGFDRVIATASNAGDAAYFYDSAGNDVFRASPAEAALRGNGFSNTAQGFNRVFAYASQGFDTASLADSAGSDLFYGRSNISWMTGGNYYNSAAGFDRVTATASGGSDIAYLYDSSGDDVYTARPTTATLSGVGFENTANGFQRVFAYATGERDEARFYDSTGNDRYTSGATSANLSGAGYSNTAFNFRRVSATATSGSDQAFFQDLGAGDTLQGEANSAAVTRAKLAELLVGFDFVTARGDTKAVKTELAAVDYLFSRE